ncbi:hypothetical protein LTR10_013751 [Elasticomyces elasticus]|nr:hypothetical protein LTR10_013751 [Elasticomyces elasticus]
MADQVSLNSYNCGAEGHVSRECTAAPKPKSCYKCGNEGHMARDCPQAGPPGGAGAGWGSGGGQSFGGGNSYGGGQTRECYRCGGQGHIARDCTSSGGQGQGQGGYGGGGYQREGGYSRGGGGGGGGQTCYNSPAAVSVICHATALKAELRNATTVVNKVTCLAIAHPSQALSASATNVRMSIQTVVTYAKRNSGKQPGHLQSACPA